MVQVQLFTRKLAEFPGDREQFAKDFRACLLNHGAEDRAKDLFFVTYEVGSGTGFCMGVKIKCLSSVSILDTSN